MHGLVNACRDTLAPAPLSTPIPPSPAPSTPLFLHGVESSGQIELCWVIIATFCTSGTLGSFVSSNALFPLPPPPPPPPSAGGGGGIETDRIETDRNREIKS